MKVFAVISEFAYDGENDATVEVFSTREKAEKFVEDLFTEFKENDHLAHKEDCVIIRDEHGFAAYEEDEGYSADHFACTILEKEVQ